uniref:DNA primase n=1 Tax=viral metagenome TaxID=1070528 RepID=A0A6M3XVY1_9ZZZZ
MTTNFANNAADAIRNAATPEEAVRSTGQLTFLRYDPRDPDMPMVFCRGPLDYVVGNLQTSGANTICRLRVELDGEMLFSGRVNLDSRRTRREIIKEHLEGAVPGVTMAEFERDLMALPDLARDKLVDLLSRGDSDTDTYVMTADDEKEALALASSPTLLADADMMLDRLNIVEEHRNRLILYLALTSRLLKEPVNIMMRGESSAGKSYIVRQVMHLLPPESFVELTEATAKSFYYLPDEALSHRFVIIFEQPGAEASDYTIRTLQSEGKLVIQTTVKNPKTQQFETIRKTLHGPVGFITTTTQSQVNFENETRLLPLFADETPGQTERILDAHGEAREGYDPGVSETDLRPWHNLQRVLKPYPVVIPFATRIAAQFPKHSQRARRDFPRFLSLMDSVVILHQYQREKRTNEHGEYLVATVEDYAIARFLLEGPLQRAIAELSPRTIQILDHCISNRYLGDGEHLPDSLMGPMDDHGQLRIFTYDDLVRAFRWKTSVVRKWVAPLFDNGYLVRMDAGRGGSGRKTRFTVNMAPQSMQVLAGLRDIGSHDDAWIPPDAWTRWPRSDDGLPALLSAWDADENPHASSCGLPSDDTSPQNSPEDDTDLNGYYL